MVHIRTLPRFWLMFDVESIGFAGEGFAVGYVVSFGERHTIAEEGNFSCDPDRAAGRACDYLWVRRNVPALEVTHEEPGGVRQAFWEVWRRWHAQGAALIADCAWPVEARFLFHCQRDGWLDAPPYPLYELASFMLLSGSDPIATQDRVGTELPRHDPLRDARQSTRLLHVALSHLKGV